MSQLTDFFNSLRRKIEKVLGTSSPVYLIVGALFLGALTEMMSRGIDLVTINDNAQGFYISIGLTLIFFFLVLVIDLPKTLRKWLHKPVSSEIIVNPAQHVEPQRGLIAIVSATRQNTPAEVAIKYHLNKGALRFCWLLAGPGKGDFCSHMNAKMLKDKYEKQGVDVYIHLLNKHDEPQEVFEAVREIYKSALLKNNLLPDEIIADYTGGNKNMTAGMALACVDQGWKIESLKPNKYNDDGTVNFKAGFTPILIDTTKISRGFEVFRKEK